MRETAEEAHVQRGVPHAEASETACVSRTAATILIHSEGIDTSALTRQHLGIFE